MKKNIIIACLFAFFVGTASAAQSSGAATPETVRATVKRIREFGELIKTSSASEAVKKDAIEKMSIEITGGLNTPFEIALTGALTTFTGEFDTRSAFVDVYTALSQTTQVAKKLGINTELTLDEVQRAGAEAVVKKMRDETLQEDPEGKDPELFEKKMKTFEDALKAKDVDASNNFKEMSADAVKKAKGALSALKSITDKTDVGVNETESIDNLLKMAEDSERLKRIKAGGPEAERQAAKFLLEKIVKATEEGARGDRIGLKESLDALGRVEKMFGENTVEQAAKIEARNASFKNAFDSLSNEISTDVEASKGGRFSWITRLRRRHTETKDPTIQDSIDSLSKFSLKGQRNVVQLEVRNMLDRAQGSRGRYANVEDPAERMQTLGDYMEALSKSKGLSAEAKKSLLKDMVKQLMDSTSALSDPIDYQEIRRTVGELIHAVRRYNRNDDLVNIINDEYKAHLHELMTNDVANSAADGLGLNQSGNSDETAQDAAQSERDAQNAGDRAAAVSKTIINNENKGPDVTGVQKPDPQANNNGKTSDGGGGSTTSTTSTTKTNENDGGLTDGQIVAEEHEHDEHKDPASDGDNGGEEEGAE